MRILDRYIIKELMGPFIFGVAAFSSIFIGTGTFFKIAQFVTKYGAPVSSVARYFIYSLPSILILTLPMSMLLASLLAFGRLSGSSEVTAMRSGGISFFRMAMPVFIVAFAVSAFSILFNELVVPEANARLNYIVKFEIEKDIHFKTQEHIVHKEIKDGVLQRLIYARKFDETTSMMEGVTVQEFDGDKLARVVVSDKAMWESDKWTMSNGVVNDLNAKGNNVRSLTFKKQVLPLTRNPKDLTREQKKPEDMTIKELKQHIQALKYQAVPTSTFEVELYNRVSIPMASFVFALIGTPLGLQPHRSSSSIGLGLSIVIIFIYYAVMTVTQALGQGGALPPIVAVYLPNIAGIIAGGILVYRASR